MTATLVRLNGAAAADGDGAGVASQALADASKAAKVAGVIKGHVVDEALGWRFRRIIEELHLWAGRFNADFGLDLPTPVLAVERLSYRTYGQYVVGRNALGVRTQVTLNEKWLVSRPFQDSLVTEGHELGHAWDEWHHGAKGAGRGGHGKRWRDRVAAIGIIPDERGATVGITPELQAWFDSYGVPLLEDLIDVQPPPTKARAMPKWTCACPPKGNPARAVHLHARCLDCGAEYVSDSPAPDPESEGEDDAEGEAE